MGKDVIIALDFPGMAETEAFLSKFTGHKPFVKIGMELYYAEGPSAVKRLKEMGHKIFLDLKLHDIPNTVKKAMNVLSRLDVDMCNLHAAGTRGQTLGLRWLTNYSRNRSENTMKERLAGEILDAANNTGSSVKKREDTHKMAEANKAFAHFRW